MRTFWISALLVLSVLAAASVEAGVCPSTFNDPYGSVCGAVWKLTSANPYGYGARPMQPYYVKYCRADMPWSCVYTTTVWAPGSDGTYAYDRYEFPVYSLTIDSNYHQWNFYAWNDSELWGSSTVPVASIWVGPQGVLFNRNIPPAPLPVTPLYPNNGNLNVPSNGITVRWSNGLDADRNSSAWPVTYEIWFKHWDFGGTEPAYPSLSATLTCNPNSYGECTTTVPSLTPGHWMWFVVADMDVSASTNTNGVFKTQGPNAYFDVP
jgi:hypothetical protein